MTVSASFSGKRGYKLCYLASFIILGSLEKDEEIMFILSVSTNDTDTSGECQRGHGSTEKTDWLRSLQPIVRLGVELELFPE